MLVDDHPVALKGLQVALRNRHPEFAIDETGSIAGAEELVYRRKPYKLLVLDYELPDAVGFSGFFRLRQAISETPIAILSSRAEPAVISTAKALGAAGILLKTEGLDELADHVDTLLNGQPVFPSDVPSHSGIKDLNARLRTLSTAQLRVLMALAGGALNKQIAADLDLSEATVKAHLTAIFRKLGVSNRLQALLATRMLLEPALPK
ncbi:response regulator transcription factor [Sphingobium sp. SCG-1]|uniref:response regulator transcription factor n=1 Tax=Sphingobium sp. SCG-1 TaxID=2072936 RepID=UPI0021D5279E|nr:response regulator transcription factor [Sphingobium sp. SCG-1]